MPPTDAIRMDNFLPTTSVVKVRKGYTNFADSMTGNVESLLQWTAGGSSKFFAAANQSIYNITAGGAVGVADITGLTNNRWQDVMFSTSGGDFLVIANGQDSVRNYNGTAWSTPAITVGTSSTFVHVMSHQSRLWFAQINSLDAWYLPSSSIAGAATKFQLGPVFTRGGYLLSLASWTLDSGSGLDDHAVFISSEGEALIYQGTDPSAAATWSLVGRYLIPRPIGRRCLMKYGGDLLIVCEDGVYSLSQALITGQVRKSVAISDKISGAIEEASQNYRAFFGWQPILYPRGSYLLVNVPTVNSSQSIQYVMNTTTNAWCKFTNQNAFCWGLFQGNLYFGGQGAVYQADNGFSDADDPTAAILETAFNYFGNTEVVKRFTRVKPVIRSNGNISPAIAINVDFGSGSPTSTPTYSQNGSPWNVSPWNVSPWGGYSIISKSWIGAAAVGRCASLHLETMNQDFEFSLAAVDYVFEPGNIS